MQNNMEWQSMFIANQSSYLLTAVLWRKTQNNKLTFSRSGSLSAKASSLLSITEAAATSRGVAPRMEGEAKGRRHKTIWTLTHKLYIYIYNVRILGLFLSWGCDPKTFTKLFPVQSNIWAKSERARHKNAYICVIKYRKYRSCNKFLLCRLPKSNFHSYIFARAALAMASTVELNIS